MNLNRPLPFVVLLAIGVTLATTGRLSGQQQRGQQIPYGQQQIGQRQIGQQPPAHQQSGTMGPQRIAHTDDRGRAAAPQRPVTPLIPTWIPLPPQHEKYVDEILGFWEYKSDQTKRYRCTFKRWEYDPVFGPKNTFKTYSEGSINYSAPDKGLFKVEKLLQYTLEEGKGVKYVPAAEESFEHWICDGRWIYEFDHRNKKLIQTELPQELRGKAIGKGPLPFLFNAKAADLEQRFWIRVVTPAEKIKEEYWLEAVPRTQDDAGNFKMAHVIINAKDYLPKAVVLFDRNIVPGKPTSRTSFEFNEREVNFSILGEKLNIFHRQFYEPSLQKGWTKEVRPVQHTATPPQGPTTKR